jgi:hypothetical protein
LKIQFVKIKPFVNIYFFARNPLPMIPYPQPATISAIWPSKPKPLMSLQSIHRVSPHQFGSIPLEGEE